MTEITVIINFDGYWLDENKGDLPEKSGIYCVYECTYNKQENIVNVQKLIYIGEAENVKNRVANHENYKNWVKHVRLGNELCFSFGRVGATDRARVEAAMIFKHEPPENDEYIDSFPYDRTTMLLSGMTALLNTSFTVNKT